METCKLRVRGKISEGGQARRGVLVRAFDTEPPAYDLLGEDTTDGRGEFAIDLALGAALPRQGLPDVTLQIFDPEAGLEIHSTLSDVDPDDWLDIEVPEDL